MKLVEISENGGLPDDVVLDNHMRGIVEAMLGVYQRMGFVRPWVGYVAIKNRVPVGTCAFKSPPVAGRVEIAYGALPGNEGQGIATAMARELIEIARRRDADLTVFAQTLTEQNASTSILKKLGFRLTGAVNHPEDGEVWEWELRCGKDF